MERDAANANGIIISRNYPEMQHGTLGHRMGGQGLGPPRANGLASQSAQSPA
jgi:hypothetical protein